MGETRGARGVSCDVKYSRPFLQRRARRLSCFIVDFLYMKMLPSSSVIIHCASQDITLGSPLES